MQITTIKTLSKEEKAKYLSMPVGIMQTEDMIRSVAESEDEKEILETTVYGINRIRIKKH